MVIRQQRIPLVLSIIVFTGAALALTLPRTPQYEATSKVSFTDLNRDLDLLGTPGGVSAPATVTGPANAEFVKTPTVARRAARLLKVRAGTDALLSSVSVNAEATTGFISISSRAQSARTASAIANAFANAAVQVRTEQERRRLKEAGASLRREINRRTRKLTDSLTAAIFSERVARIETLADIAQPAKVEKLAEAPGSPSSPKVLQTTLLGVLIGLLVGLLAAFVRDTLDARIRSGDDLLRDTEAPVLGQVPRAALGKPPALVAADDKAALEGADAFRALRTNLAFLDPDRPVRCVVVTSPSAGEGKTTVAAGLCASVAATGRRSLLIECDLRQPDVAARLAVEPVPGLADMLLGRAETQDMLRHLGPAAGNGRPNGSGERFDVIPIGARAEITPETLGTSALHDLVSVVSRAYDLVVLDTSPLLPVADTLQVIPFADAIVLCVRSSKTTHGELRSALGVLSRLPAKPLGIVLTGVTKKDTDLYSGSYGAGEPVAAR